MAKHRRELMRLEGVCKSVAGELVLENVSLTINDGDFICIRGISGVGKTTLLKIIALVTRPDKGNVIFLGKNTKTLSNSTLALLRLKYIGYIPQELGLLEMLSVEENILLPLYTLGINKKDATKVTNEILNKLGIIDKKDYYPRSLSGGERQRVAIARALAKKPLLIVADEPLSNLDDVNAGMILDLFREYVVKQGGAVIMSTTDLYADYPCTKDYFLAKGKLYFKKAKTAS